MTPTELRIINDVIDTFEQPVFLQRATVYMAVPAAVFLAAFLASLSGGTSNGIGDVNMAASDIIPGGNMTAWEIFQNNARILLGILVGGTLTFSLGSFVLLMLNGSHFGSGIGFYLGSYGNVTAVAAFAPHGVFEVVAFLVAASVVLRVSVLLATWRVFGRETVLVERDTALDLAALTVVAFALVALGAMVETTVTVAFVGWVG